MAGLFYAKDKKHATIKMRYYIKKKQRMKLFITAKPRSKEQSVEKIDDTHFVVAVKEPPVHTLANRAIIKTLAVFLNIAPSHLSIISGHASRRKVIEVL